MGTDETQIKNLGGHRGFICEKLGQRTFPA
jgi:hypothetical protein